MWALSGATPTALNARIKKAYAAGEFKVPVAGAMAYMLSPGQHLSDADPHWMPHLIFFYDRSVNTDAFGAGDDRADHRRRSECACAGDVHSHSRLGGRYTRFARRAEEIT